MLVSGFFALALCAAAPAEVPPGLYVEQGVLKRAGQPVQAIGVNYYNLLDRAEKEPDGESWRDSLRRLKAADIPFVRFRCGAWSIADWDLYRSDKPEYLRRMDGLVRAAEEIGIGLIPSLFWSRWSASDMVAEPVGRLGVADSKVRAFMHQYVAEIVGRYRQSPAIWGWEFGNEYNLCADLPNAANHRPPVPPKRYGIGPRTAADDLSLAAVQSAIEDFGSSVRAIDPRRALFTGNSLPRENAWHNTHEKKWTKDSREQFLEMLLASNPNPVDTLTVHYYPGVDTRYGSWCADTDAMLVTLMEAARSSGKPLFLGEIGPAEKLSATEDRAVFTALLAAVERHRVPLAAVWVFDFPLQDKSFNITFENERSYMLEMISAANRRAGLAADRRK